MLAAKLYSVVRDQCFDYLHDGNSYNMVNTRGVAHTNSQ